MIGNMEKNAPKRKENDRLKRTLRKSGYKATPARLEILRAFATISEPMSAQELMSVLPADIDQATIYRNLKSLKTKGLIRQIDLRHNHAHYELTDTKEHHHLICLRCGRIEDVHRCGAEEMQTQIIRNSKNFAEIRQHTLEFYGVCKWCARKDEGAAIPAHKI